MISINGVAIVTVIIAVIASIPVHIAIGVNQDFQTHLVSYR